MARKKTKHWKQKRVQKQREKVRMRKNNKPTKTKPKKSTLWDWVVHPWTKSKDK
jgi:hypothetical protein